MQRRTSTVVDSNSGIDDLPEVLSKPTSVSPARRRQRWGAALARAISVALLSLAIFAISHVAAQDWPVVPDDGLTPGEIATTDATEVCVPGYARSMRHTSGRIKAMAYRQYGIDRRSGHFEIDHRVPLELGGADTEANLWPESYDTEPWNAHVKDRLEERLHAMVCNGELSLPDAQSAFLGNWTDAYRRYLGDP